MKAQKVNLALKEASETYSKGILGLEARINNFEAGGFTETSSMKGVALF